MPTISVKISHFSISHVLERRGYTVMRLKDVILENFPDLKVSERAKGDKTLYKYSLVVPDPKFPYSKVGYVMNGTYLAWKNKKEFDIIIKMLSKWVEDCKEGKICNNPVQYTTDCGLFNVQVDKRTATGLDFFLQEHRLKLVIEREICR